MGVVQDYTKRKGVASVKIIAPSGSPAWVFLTSTLLQPKRPGQRANEIRAMA
ncbi:MobA/MobL family protein [Xanthomonas translucens]|uniref:MobA/MobL family protein n=1 Tax=Xanthomonas campestris pv. translucens TaxID=343 RepID=UPI001F5FFB42|nr:MobA/MobL family protein [Xanthomonas translucens]